MISLGSRATDRITGFSGVVTGRCEYITGCNQLLIQPRVGTDGGHREPHWFDEQRLQVGTEPVLQLDNGSTPGFDRAPPKR